MLQEIAATDPQDRASALFGVLDAVPPQLWEDAFTIAKGIPHFAGTSVFGHDDRKLAIEELRQAGRTGLAAD